MTSLLTLIFKWIGISNDHLLKDKVQLSLKKEDKKGDILTSSFSNRSALRMSGGIGRKRVVRGRRDRSGSRRWARMDLERQ